MFANKLLKNLKTTQCLIQHARHQSVMTQKLIYTEYGDPLKVLQRKDEEMCENINPNEILVRMLAAPINPADINTIQGKYPAKPTLPAIAGNEGVAEVVDVGSEVANLTIGDRVVPLAPGLGTWRTHAILPKDSIFKVPKDLGIAEAATLTVNPCTAYRMLKDFVTLSPGDVIIQNGANSACGQYVIQLCRVWGIQTVNIVRDRENLADLKRSLTGLGANWVLTEEELRKAEVFKSGQLQAPSLALNCVGGKNALEIMRHLSPNGTIVTYGGMSKEPVIVPTSALIFKNIRVFGFWMTRWSKDNFDSEERNEMLEELEVNDILFSNGELDIDKVLCLHLLTAHRTETLTPPSRKRRSLSLLSKDQSPLERLIERSRKKRRIDNLTKLLPTYVLDIEASKKENSLIRDGRLSERMIINDNIVQIMHAVLAALQNSNFEKMQELISKANSKTFLTELVEKPNVQEFMSALQKQVMISRYICSCDCFHLTQPFRSAAVSLKLTTSSHSLITLVNHIRKNVLQYPNESTSTWKSMYYDSPLKEEVEESLTKEFYKYSNQKASNVNQPQDFTSVSTTVARSVSKNIRKTIVNDDKECCNSFIQHPTIKINEDRNDDREKALELTTNTIDEIRRDQKTSVVGDASENLTQRKSLVAETGNANITVKRPRIVSLDQINDYNIKKVTLTEFARIIDSQVKKLSNTRITKIEKTTGASLGSRKSDVRRNLSQIGSHQSVGLSMLNLAKLSHQIRNQETQKKLKIFLQSAK
ncbi:hypothetical protein FQA39_LY10207 [Lamprigera yunnana]|nr:hypothetical protein FQA39_LY10207 [Lamprigera yunnana]